MRPLFILAMLSAAGASAAMIDIGNFPALQAQISGCTGPLDLRITANITVTTTLETTSSLCALTLQGADDTIALSGSNSYHLFVRTGSVVAKNLMFVDGNSGDAGAVYVWGQATFENCVFAGNFGLNCGAVRAGTYSQVTFKNCVFNGNTALYDGGAVRVQSYAQASFDNCVFDGNKAREGDDIFVRNGVVQYDCYDSSIDFGYTGSLASLRVIKPCAGDNFTASVDYGLNLTAACTSATASCTDPFAPECDTITIANEYLNGSVTAFGVGYSSINVLAKTLDVVVFETSGVRGGDALSMTCDGTNIQSDTFAVTTAAGDCENPDGATSFVEAYNFSVTIDDVFTQANLTLNNGVFTAYYTPKCVLSINGIPIATEEKNYTVLIENNVIINVTAITLEDTVGVEDVNDVEISAIVGVILDNPNVVFVDGEVVELEFNLENLVDSAEQTLFQIQDITDLIITVGGDAYPEASLVLYNEADTGLGLTVSFLLPTAAYGPTAQLVQIDGTALVELAAGNRRRANDIQAATFTLNAIASPRSDDAAAPESEDTTASSAHTTAAVSTAALAASGLAALASCF